MNYSLSRKLSLKGTHVKVNITLSLSALTLGHRFLKIGAGKKALNGS